MSPLTSNHPFSLHDARCALKLWSVVAFADELQFKLFMAAMFCILVVNLTQIIIDELYNHLYTVERLLCTPPWGPSPYRYSNQLYLLNSWSLECSFGKLNCDFCHRMS
jgi:hypothetical protein